MKAEDDTRKVLRLSFDSFSIPTFEQPLTEDNSVLLPPHPQGSLA